VAFVVIAAIIGTASVLMGDNGPLVVTLATADIAYLFITLSAVNAALFLGMLNRPWEAAGCFAAGLPVILAIHGASSWLGRPTPAGSALIAASTLVFLVSTVTVRRSLRRVDHAVAVAV
jgi:hypothetical protein